MHEIYRFTGGRAGQRANVDACVEALRLGEEYGITPLPESQASEEDPGIASDVTGTETNTDQKKEESAP
jgi:hypothetical protein